MIKPGDWAKLSYSQSVCPVPVSLNESSDRLISVNKYALTNSYTVIKYYNKYIHLCQTMNRQPQEYDPYWSEPANANIYKLFKYCIFTCRETKSYLIITKYNLQGLKEHSQLAHMFIRYSFIANLHITEMR